MNTNYFSEDSYNQSTYYYNYDNHQNCSLNSQNIEFNENETTSFSFEDYSLNPGAPITNTEDTTSNENNNYSLLNNPLLLQEYYLNPDENNQSTLSFPKSINKWTLKHFECYEKEYNELLLQNKTIETKELTKILADRLNISSKTSHTAFYLIPKLFTQDTNDQINTEINDTGINNIHIQQSMQNMTHRIEECAHPVIANNPLNSTDLLFEHILPKSNSYISTHVTLYKNNTPEISIPPPKTRKPAPKKYSKKFTPEDEEKFKKIALELKKKHREEHLEKFRLKLITKDDVPPRTKTILQLAYQFNLSNEVATYRYSKLNKKSEKNKFNQ